MIERLLCILGGITALFFGALFEALGIIQARMTLLFVATVLFVFAVYLIEYAKEESS